MGDTTESEACVEIREVQLRCWATEFMGPRVPKLSESENDDVIRLCGQTLGDANAIIFQGDRRFARKAGSDTDKPAWTRTNALKTHDKEKPPRLRPNARTEALAGLCSLNMCIWCTMHAGNDGVRELGNQKRY